MWISRKKFDEITDNSRWSSRRIDELTKQVEKLKEPPPKVRKWRVLGDAICHTITAHFYVASEDGGRYPNPPSSARLVRFWLDDRVVAEIVNYTSIVEL